MEEKKKNISELMNLIGYGLAKFDIAFANEFGVTTKTAFYQLIVELGLANTIKAVSNRQDSFDPYFENGRKGWYQRTQRKHIKLFIDSLFGKEDVKGFANIVKLYIQEHNKDITIKAVEKSPIIQSKFKQLQETGKEAEFYFLSNFQTIEQFANGVLEDARLWGDGYDFQIHANNQYSLVEVKGLQGKSGSIRLTKNEYQKAQEFKTTYILAVISNLSHSPKLNIVENPLKILNFTCKEIVSTQLNYHTDFIRW